MFQAIVHAPALRAGARLSVSDLSQTAARAPRGLEVGDAVALRFGVCCPDLGAGAIVELASGTATLQVAETRWRLRRCLAKGGCGVPGLVAEDWFVVARGA